MLVCEQTPRKNVQLVNRPSENTATVYEINLSSGLWMKLMHILLKVI